MQSIRALAWSFARVREKLPCLINASLTAAERVALFAFPIEKSELIRLYTFSEQDLSVIKQRREDVNRLGFAVLLCGSAVPWPIPTAIAQL
jgi:hypothetical protein